MTAVLVITVAYRSSTEMPRFIETLATSTSRAIRLVVVDNGPVATVVPPSPTPRLTIEALRCIDNPGYGTAVNRGAAGASEDWIVVTNPDISFEPGSLDELLSRAESIMGIGMAGPQIRTPIGEVYPSARRLPSLRSGVGHALFSRIWPENPWTRRYLADESTPLRERTAGWLSGACFAIPREVFVAARGFDETYFMYFEDVDLSARVGKLGYRVVYIPSAVVSHSGGASTGVSNRRMILAHHRSAYRYLSRQYRGASLAPLRVVLRLGLAVRGRLVHR